MNTVKSFWVGWGSLIVAGAGAYYYAKKEINADRREKYLKRQQSQYEQNMLQYSSGTDDDGHSNPAKEATNDPAPTRHAPQNEEQSVREKSKYEASVVYRAPRGDRFT
ncbi:hypothetical protein EDC01DRAFT_329561 [Geopyxis carbonaria]|nr:hypothetical protein EDC01DRAFT_329561 [Geopyxis carbonaria]